MNAKFISFDVHDMARRPSRFSSRRIRPEKSSRTTRDKTYRRFKLRQICAHSKGLCPMRGFVKVLDVSMYRQSAGNTVVQKENKKKTSYTNTNGKIKESRNIGPRTNQPRMIRTAGSIPTRRRKRGQRPYGDRVIEVGVRRCKRLLFRSQHAILF